MHWLAKKPAQTYGFLAAISMSRKEKATE